MKWYRKIAYAMIYEYIIWNDIFKFISNTYKMIIILIILILKIFKIKIINIIQYTIWNDIEISK
jgi:hypothetical protein